MALPDMVFSQWIFVRYIKDDASALAPAAWFGICFLIARVIGALAEPAIGHWSDTFRSASGRRLPFVRRGLVPFVFAFFLLWTPPIDHQHWLNAVYGFALMQAYLLCYPLVLTPYLALMPEMTSDLRERLTLTTLQAVFMLLGSIVFAAMGVILQLGGWLVVGGAVSLLVFTALLPTATVLREKPVLENREQLSLWTSIRWTVANRPFRHLALSTALFMFAFNIAVMGMPFWVKVYLGRSEETVTLLMLPLLGTTMALFTAIGPLVSRFGKFRVFAASIIGTACCMALLASVGYLPFGSPLAQMFVIVTLIGVPMTGFSALPFALLADVIDYDEQRTGHRREAIFFAVQGTIQKVFIGLAGLAFSILAYWGPGDNVTEFGLRLVTGSGAAAALTGLAVFCLYPLRERDGKVICLGSDTPASEPET